MSDEENKPKIQRVKSKRPLTTKQIQALEKGRANRVKNAKQRKLITLLEETKEDADIKRMLKELSAENDGEVFIEEEKPLKQISKPKQKIIKKEKEIAETEEEEEDEEETVEEEDETEEEPEREPTPPPKPKKEKKPKIKAKIVKQPMYYERVERVEEPVHQPLPIPQPIPIPVMQATPANFISASDARRALKQSQNIGSVDIFRN